MASQVTAPSNNNIANTYANVKQMYLQYDAMGLVNEKILRAFIKMNGLAKTSGIITSEEFDANYEGMSNANCSKLADETKKKAVEASCKKIKEKLAVKRDADTISDSITERFKDLRDQANTDPEQADKNLISSLMRVTNKIRNGKIVAKDFSDLYDATLAAEKFGRVSPDNKKKNLDLITSFDASNMSEKNREAVEALQQLVAEKTKPVPLQRFSVSHVSAQLQERPESASYVDVMALLPNAFTNINVILGFDAESKGKGKGTPEQQKEIMEQSNDALQAYIAAGESVLSETSYVRQFKDYGLPMYKMLHSQGNVHPKTAELLMEKGFLDVQGNAVKLPDHRPKYVVPEAANG